MTSLRGGLPMYDLPELRKATDAWWAGLTEHLAAEGVEGLPSAPERPGNIEDLWLSPDLLVAQTCGYPLTHTLAGCVSYVGTPAYAAPGCEGTSYRSVILVRRKDACRSLLDLRGRVAAVNAWDSQSGMNALRHAVAGLAGGDRFFGSVVETGGHRASLAALQAGAVDVAAVDCVTYALIQREAPGEVEGLRCLSWSRAVPGLPLIAAKALGGARLRALRQGLAAAFEDPALAGPRKALLLAGFQVLPERAYEPLLAMEREAAAAGYPRLS